MKVNAGARDAALREDWYFKVVGEELGPFTFEEIVGFVEQGHLGDEVEVKIGLAGEWSRVESNSRLVAVIPRQDSPASSSPNATNDSRPKSAPKPSESASKVIAPSPIKAPVAAATTVTVAQTVESELNSAQAAHATIEQATKKLIVSVFGSNCEQVWWGWIGGVQYGPVDFVQLIGWVTDGRLRSTDFVRYGTQGQYTLVGAVPGLLHAATIINHATEVLQLARSLSPAAKTGAQPQPTVASRTSPQSESVQPPQSAINTTAAAVPPPVLGGPPPSASPTTTKTLSPAPAGDVPAAKPAVAEIAPQASKTSEKFVSTGGSRPLLSSNPMSTSRPVSSGSKPTTKPYRPASQSAISQALEKLKEPKVAAGAAAVAAVLLLLVGWLLFSPAGSAADIQRYRELKKVLDDVRAKRDAKGTDFAEIIARAEKLKADYGPVLRKEADNQHPEKQALLWAVQDELPRFLKQKLTSDSKAEKDFAQRLDEAAQLMRIKP